MTGGIGVLLIGVREENGWLTSRWQLTYCAGWEQIKKAVFAAFDCYSDGEILIDGKPAGAKTKEEVMGLEERGNLVLRGMSEIVGVPMMITFYNQMAAVDLAVMKTEGEFDSDDYKKFNLSLGQYMDSLELSMYR